MGLGVLHTPNTTIYYKKNKSIFLSKQTQGPSNTSIMGIFFITIITRNTGLRITGAAKSPRPLYGRGR